MPTSSCSYCYGVSAIMPGAMAQNTTEKGSDEGLGVLRTQQVLTAILLHLWVLRTKP